MRQGLSETAQRVLDELDLMDWINDPARALTNAQAHMLGGASAINAEATVTRYIMAAASMIRLAELLQDRLAAQPPQPAAEPIGEDQQD